MPTALAIAAHPDDIEIFMSGTFMLLKEVGYELHYMNVANGCCGTSEYDRTTISKMRRDEAIAAAELIGAVFHEPICDDLSIFFDQPTLAKIASVMRLVAPEIVLTHPPADYMEDHTNVCRLATTAAFTRGMPNFPVDPPREPVPGKVTVYHAQPFSHRDPLRRLVTPDMFVNVTEVVERKVAMLAKHVSQKKWLDESQGHDSYLQTLRDLDAECGRMSGMFKYAEGWRRHLHLGYCDQDDDPLRKALHDRVLMAN
jgi:LmbE family N-acetylglucosaminyl deacetylase